MPTREKKLTELFNEIFNQSPEMVISAPGRINLIGEHTDYNEGYVLPVPIGYNILMAGTGTKDEKVSIYATDLKKQVKFNLSNIEIAKDENWSNYSRGVIALLQKKGFKLSGVNLAFTGNIPIGAGLSSSAALEVATAKIVSKLNGLEIQPIELIKLCQEAEHEFAGTKCGIMDQFVSTLGAAGQALFLDCRSLRYELVPLQMTNTHQLVICDSGVKHQLVSSSYNTRRQECEEGVKILKKYLPNIRALRDVTMKDFNLYNQYLPKNVRKRCEHVIWENNRVLKAVTALKNNNLKKFGKLLNSSHQSLKNLYEVSCSEVDLMAGLAQDFKGCLGSRMTGGGFGGCTISLVRKNSLAEFKKLMKKVSQRIFLA